MFSFKTWAVSKALKKIEKNVKKETGYDVNVSFNDPIKMKVKDGRIYLHASVDAEADLGLITEFMEKEES